MTISRWRMAAKVTSRRPTSPPPSPPSSAATTRPRPRSPPAPRRVSPSVRRAGSRPTTSPASSRSMPAACPNDPPDTKAPQRKNTMNMTPRLRAAAPPAAPPSIPPPPPRPQSFSAPQRGEIEQIIRDYLLAHPELLEEVSSELDKRKQLAEAEKAKTAIKNHSEALFNSARQVTVGNPQGDVTLVEFFDYNCGYCKRALLDLTQIMKGDSKLRVVLKEFPVLGPGSVEAAQVAVAVRMQDKGKKYFDFHQRLLGGRGQADKARALAAAKEAGFDMARIEKDLASDEVRASIDESMKLAEALGLNGTPSYVVGSDVVIGAAGGAAPKREEEKWARGETVRGSGGSRGGPAASGRGLPRPSTSLI